MAAKKTRQALISNLNRVSLNRYNTMRFGKDYLGYSHIQLPIFVFHPQMSVNVVIFNLTQVVYT